MSPTTDVRALALAAVSAAAFGLSGPFAKALLDAGWSPSAAVLARVGGAAAVLAPLVVRQWRRRRPSAANARIVLAYGLTAVAGTQFAYFSAVQTLSVGVALLLEYLAPVLLVGLAWARTRSAPPTGTLIGTVLSMVGLVLVLDLGGGVSVDPVGVAWGLAAAVCLSAYFVLSARVDDGLPAVVLAGGGLAVGTVTLAVLGVAGIVPLEASTGPVELLGASVSWLVPVVVLVGVSTVAAYLTGITATARLGSRVASFVGLTEVLFAVLAAWWLLGELPVPIQLLGGVGIVAGVALVHRDTDDRHDPASEPVPVTTA
ncbi:DMT family transporter [Euzebya sp.]|uniref:EamA family transporter n=1 Tax=Euzebya sp. TaxID=1971409 RepID=UPI003511C7DD